MFVQSLAIEHNQSNFCKAILVATAFKVKPMMIRSAGVAAFGNQSYYMEWVLSPS